ncbi:MAG TPA: O-antigen polymerase [Gemmatirosa sp.]
MKHAVLTSGSPVAAAGPRNGARTGELVVLGIAIAAVAASVVYAAAQFMGIAIVACGFVAALLVAPIGLRWATGRFDVFEPAMIIAGVYLFYFVFGPLARIATEDFWFLDRNFQSVYVPALEAIAVAVAAMWVGYALPVGPTPALAGEPPSPIAAASMESGQRMARMLVTAAVLGMVAWARLSGHSLLYFLLPGVTRPVDSAEGGVDVPYLFFAVEWFIPAVTVLIALGGLRGRATRAAVIGVLTVMYVSIGFRYRVAILWFAVAIVTYLRAGRRPRLLYMAVPATLAFLLGGWLAGARAFFRSNGAEGTLAFDLRGSVVGGLSDTRIFETLGAVVTTVPRFLPHAGLLPFAYPLILLVPRSLWPGKPLPFWLQYNVQSIGTPPSTTSGAAVPHFGEFYIAFGWAGIALGMFLFGLAAKWLWRWYRAAPNDPWRQAIFALNSSLLFLTIARGYLAQIVQEWCFVVLPAIALAALARRRARFALSAGAGARAEVVEGA